MTSLYDGYPDPDLAYDLRQEDRGRAHKKADVERTDRDYLYGLVEIPSDKNVCHSCKQDIGNDARVRIDGQWMHAINEDCTAALYRAAEAGELRR